MMAEMGGLLDGDGRLKEALLALGKAQIDAMSWVFDPRSGGTKIGEAVRERTRRRILAHAEKHYADRYTSLDVARRGRVFSSRLLSCLSFRACLGLRDSDFVLRCTGLPAACSRLPAPGCFQGRVFGRAAAHAEARGSGQ